MTDQTADTDADVLFPDVDLSIGGKTVTVREFRFFEGMKLAREAAALLRDMASLLSDSVAAADLADIGDLFANHEQILSMLLQTSTGQDAEFIAGLNDSDGQKLLITFWTVNKAFFINRLLLNKFAAARKEKQQAETATAPTTS